MKTKGKFKLVKKVVGIAAGIILGIGVVTVGVAYKNVKTAVNNSYAYVPNHANDGRDLNKLLSKSKPINMMILGFGYRGHADACMMISINPHKKSAKVVSVSKNRILKNGNTITTEYNKSGVAGEMKALHDTYRVPIDTYVTINTTGLANAVDKVHGIEVNVGTTKHPKMVHMNGRQAVDYCQGNNPQDYSKTILPVMQGILKKVGTLKAIFNNDFLNALSSDMQSDLTLKQLFLFGWHYGTASKHSKKYIAHNPKTVSRLLNNELGLKYSWDKK